MGMCCKQLPVHGQMEKGEDSNGEGMKIEWQISLQHNGKAATTVRLWMCSEKEGCERGEAVGAGLSA